MPLVLKTTNAFEKDLQKARKRGRKLDALWGVVDDLLDGKPLDPRYRPHKLSGNWSGYWECHIESDWLLIWLNDRNEVIVLVRLGSHSELFG